MAKMKKLLLLCTAMAMCASLGFAACGKNNSSSSTNGDASSVDSTVDSSTDSSETPTPAVTDVTEAEWKTAMNGFSSTKLSYTMDNMTQKIDGNKVYDSLTIGGVTYESYTEVDDANQAYTDYNYDSAHKKWVTTVHDLNAEDDPRYMLGSFATMPLKLTQDGANVTPADAYSAFTYANDVYTGTLYIEFMPGSVIPATITCTFADKALVSLKLEATMGEGANASSMTIHFGDPTVSITLPTGAIKASELPAYVAVEGYSYEDMTKKTGVPNDYNTATPITVTLPAGEYIVFSDMDWVLFGNTTDVEFIKACSLNVNEASEVTFYVKYADIVSNETETDVPYYIYSLTGATMEMTGGELDLLGYGVENDVRLDVPTAGRYKITFAEEIEVNGTYANSYVFETEHDHETVFLTIKGEAVAGSDAFTVNYTITEAPAQPIALGDNTQTVEIYTNNLFTFTAEEGEYKLVCNDENVMFGLYNESSMEIDYYCTYTYNDNGVAKNALFINVQKSNEPVKVYATTEVATTEVTFTISTLTTAEKYPTAITVNDELSNRFLIPTEGAVEINLDGATAGETYFLGWTTEDDCALQIGTQEFRNGGVWFVYTEGMEMAFVGGKSNSSVRGVYFNTYGNPMNNGEYDVYMDGTNGMELSLNVTQEVSEQTYTITWFGDYTVNGVTDGATGITSENITVTNPITVTITASNTEGKLTLTVTQIETGTEELI